MRKLLLLFILFFSTKGQAQFTYDMENYTVGTQIFEGHWTDFNCGGSCAIYASDDIAHGGLVSGLVPGDMITDGVLDLGNKIFDVWHLEFWMYIPSGREAFFTILSTVPYEPPNIGYFYFNLDNNSPGQGIINDVAIGDVPFTFPHDEWFSIKFTVDISSGIWESTWQLFIDEVELIPCGTPFTDDFGTIPTSLGGIEFFSIYPTTTFYLDDFSYWNSTFTCQLGLEDILLDKINIYPNPVNSILKIGNIPTVEIISINIFDAFGRLVLNKTNNLELIDLSHLNSGLLFIVLKTNRGVVTKKIIKE